MNYGPLQFAAYLARTGGRPESAAVRAARAAAPGVRQVSRVSVISCQPAERVAPAIAAHGPLAPEQVGFEPE